MTTNKVRVVGHPDIAPIQIDLDRHDQRVSFLEVLPHILETDCCPNGDLFLVGGVSEEMMGNVLREMANAAINAYSDDPVIYPAGTPNEILAAALRALKDGT